ncbi:MAG: exo-alpha-sialidase [Verrucomicrobiaceae bacterium]
MKSLSRLALVVWCGFASASAQDFFSELFNPLAPFLSIQPSQTQQPQSGPWNNDVIIYRATLDGKAEKTGTFERAGVPTLARLQDGRLIAAYQHFPSDDERHFDRVAVSFSEDEGRTWSKGAPIEVGGMEEGLARPFDPTLVPLPDGRIRLYFTSNRHRDFRMSTPQIYSTISTDGIHYTFEPGVRFGVEGRIVIDCAVVLHQGMFHLYSPDNGSAESFFENERQHQPPPAGRAYHATSTDGLKFTRVDDVTLNDDVRWLGNAQSDGKTITFFGTGRGVFTAKSTDGAKWQPADHFAVQGADPGAVAAKDGGWIMTVTGPPRNQAPQETMEPWLQSWTDELRIFDSASSDPSRSTSPAPSQAITDWGAFWSQGRAQGSGMVTFTHSPMRVTDIERIAPYGMMVGGHVCPIDHGYFFPKAGVTAEVLAPADGFIVVIAHRTQLRGSTERQRDYDDYALTIEHSGTFYTLYDLISTLDEAILAQLDASTRSRFANKNPGPPLHVRIPVKGGQKLGTVSGRSLDFSVVNTQTRLPGLLHPEIYGHYAWRAHMADMFESFDGDLKSQLLALNVRKTPPFGGKIDFDIAGHLSGNWFRSGSGGYAGDMRDPRGYWMGHLAFVRHHLDPTRIVISIGNFDGRPRQFAISGDSPDPEKITAKDGIVKFELVYVPLDNLGRRIELPPEMRGVQGVALAQVLEGEKLKFEVFPGVSEAKGFTDAAREFER